MSKCGILKELIEARVALAVPGVYDAFSALLAEQEGFQAVQVSGFAVAASVLGLPDIGILTMRDQINAVQSIANAVSIPVMADGDTGFGNPVNAFHAVRLIEAAGAAGINIEDQTFPKRCGHMDGKSVIPMEEMVQKVRAAAQARQDPDFVINARTDAIATDGVPAAITRANAYLEAGATVIFLEAPRTKEDMVEIVRSVNGPVSFNMVGGPGGKTPPVSHADLKAMGVGRVSYPGLTIMSAGAAMRKGLRLLATTGDFSSMNDELMSFSEITAVVGLPAAKALGQEYGS